VRVDGSGSTQLLTQYLALDPGWQLGIGNTVVWPKCAQQVQGSDGVISYLAATPNAIG
jgi:ABC-type phosphate transport system substrate-binding protein